MQATLLLNASYEPLRIISWKKALTLFFAGKVEIIEEHDREILRQIADVLDRPVEVIVQRLVEAGLELVEVLVARVEQAAGGEEVIDAESGDRDPGAEGRRPAPPLPRASGADEGAQPAKTMSNARTTEYRNTITSYNV